MIRLLKENKYLLFFWLIGCLHIITQGFRLDLQQVHRNENYVFEYPLKGVIYFCCIFSIYFIVSLICKYTGLKKSSPWITYFICTIIVIAQFGFAALAAIHAPPFVSAYIMNALILIICQLTLIPILLMKQYRKKK